MSFRKRNPDYIEIPAIHGIQVSDRQRAYNRRYTRYSKLFRQNRDNPELLLRIKENLDRYIDSILHVSSENSGTWLRQSFGSLIQQRGLSLSELKLVVEEEPDYWDYLIHSPTLDAHSAYAAEFIERFLKRSREKDAPKPGKWIKGLTKLIAHHHPWDIRGVIPTYLETFDDFLCKRSKGKDFSTYKGLVFLMEAIATIPELSEEQVQNVYKKSGELKTAQFIYDMLRHRNASVELWRGVVQDWWRGEENASERGAIFRTRRAYTDPVVRTRLISLHREFYSYEYFETLMQDATGEEAGRLVKQAAEEDPARCVEVIEELSEKITSEITEEDISPLFKAEEKEVRVAALTLLRKIRRVPGKEAAGKKVDLGAAPKWR